MARTVSGLLLGVTALMVAGCAAGPSEAEVTERFLIELRSANPSLAEMAPEDAAKLEAIAQDITSTMREGACGASAARRQFDPDLQYAWDATCLMYFEGDMSELQISDAESNLVDEIARRLED